MKNLIQKNINAEIKEAFRLLKKDQREEARAIFLQLNEHSIDDVEALRNLGKLASQLSEKIYAINICSDLVQRHPENAVYLDDLGQAFLENGMYLDAENRFNAAIEINPDLYHPYFGLAYIAMTNDMYSNAVQLLEKAVQLKPSEASIYINLVNALIFDSRADEAYEYAQKLVRLQSDKVEGYHLSGQALAGMGRFDDAISNLEKAIRIDNTYGYSYGELAGIKKFTAADGAFIKQTEKTLHKSMPVAQRSAINFALGKMYSDCKEWDKAFDFYKQANLLAKPAVLVNDIKLLFNKSHTFYSKNFFEKHKDLGSDSDVPVFVVGMPRSGTTLIEQIIASHPEGGGAGELKTMIDDIHLGICPIDDLGNYKQALSRSLNIETINKYVDHYLSVLCDKREDNRRIVDKMPGNFVNLGLIHLLFPKAHIIHAVRSPLDVSLSCFFQSFIALDWSYDLASIAEHYRFYKKAMAYWKKVLPEGKIIEVQYEKLTAEPELEAKKLIESIGLQWDPACLEFHKAKSVVNTASLWQVRQPVYASSRRRWANYAKNIDVLVKELQEYLDDEDIEELKRQGFKLKKKWSLNPFA